MTEEVQEPETAGSLMSREFIDSVEKFYNARTNFILGCFNFQKKIAVTAILDLIVHASYIRLRIRRSLSENDQTALDKAVNFFINMPTNFHENDIGKAYPEVSSACDVISDLLDKYEFDRLQYKEVWV